MPTTPLGVWYPGPNDTFPPGFSGAEGGTGWFEQLAESVDDAIEDYVGPGWGHIAAGTVNAAAPSIDVTAGGAFPAGTFAMVRLHFRGGFSTGSDFMSMRINGSTDAINTWGTYVIGGDQAFKANSTGEGGALARLGHMGAPTAAQSMELTIYNTDVSSQCPWKSETTRFSTTVGTHRHSVGWGALDADRLLSSIQIRAVDLGARNVVGRWWLEGYLQP